MALYNEMQLCEKITSIYPEIGTCGIDIGVTYDPKESSWVVHLKKDLHSLNHFLNLMDADKCMDGKQCVALGLEIAQLRKNVEGKQF